MYDGENPYQVLKAELARTGVISEEYKGVILGYMMAGMQYASDRGRIDGYRILGVEQDSESKLWYILDERGERLHGPYQSRPHMGDMLAEVLSAGQ